MAQTVAQHQQGAFTTPINGTSADASVVLSNDNTVRSTYNSHDSDTGIHLQSSTLAARPAASIAGQKWLTTDGLRIYYDTGSAWSEVAYALAASPTFTGTATFSGAITGPTSLTFTGTTATTGAIRLANNTSVSWRDSGNFADYGLKLDASNVFQFPLPVNFGAGLKTSGTSLDFGPTAGQISFSAGANTRFDLIVGGSTFLQFNTGGYGNNSTVIVINNTAGVPNINPTGAGLLFVDSGALKYRGSSGTVTTIANA